MKHVFIIDPKSYRNQQWRMDALLDTVGQYFRAMEGANFSTLVSTYPRSAVGLIQKQVDEADPYETTRVYAIGGDEIFFDCLNGIAGLPNMELAPLPQEDTISFLRTFGEGKSELFRNIPTLAEAPTVSTDMIAVGNFFAINGGSVGIASATAMRLQEARRVGRGFSRFSFTIWYSLLNLLSYFNKELTAHQYKVMIDGEDYSGQYSVINIYNSPYFGRRKPLAGSMPDDGLLDVALFRSAGPFATLSSLRKFANGKIPPNCTCLQAKRVRIISETPMWIQADREFLQDTSITFEVVPGAVQIVAVDNLAYQGSENDNERS